MKLNIGCGRNPFSGWINLDRMPLPGVDIVYDLELCDKVPIPLDDDSVEEFYMSHVLEHIKNPLQMMQELHRIAKPDAVFTILVPYGSSDGAWEDPTHVRLYFKDSFGYFGQPYYWLADYGYRGDWKVETINLILPDSPLRFCTSMADITAAVQHHRNMVNEMTTVLRAVKPIREPLPELRDSPALHYLFDIPPGAPTAPPPEYV